MTKASKKAYEEMLPKMRGKKLQIIACLAAHGDQSTGAIEFFTGMHYSTLTARLSDLWDEGLIYPLEDRNDRYSVWRLSDEDQRAYIKERRRYARFIKWLKKGTEFFDLIPDFAKRWIEERVK